MKNFYSKNRSMGGRSFGAIFPVLCLLIGLVGGPWAMAAELTPDEAVQQDLKTAYDIAQTHFTDNPRQGVSLTDLATYGFRATEDVTIRILDGTRGGLQMNGTHVDSIRTYQIDKDGEVALEGEAPTRRRERGRR